MIKKKMVLIMAAGAAGRSAQGALHAPQAVILGALEGITEFLPIFFFQAEDGIRHYKVTGVQTCALPISPPRQPLIAVSGNPPAIDRDEHGIAKGGVRLPDVEVPTGCNTGYNAGAGLEALVGSTQPFPPAKLKKLYPSNDAYVAKVAAAAKAAREAGVILPHTERDYVKRAKASAI